MQQMPENARLAQEQRIDHMVTQLELSRQLERVIVHIDMDAFYAAVELRDRPELKGKPMAVGGKDMLCTANYGKFCRIRQLLHYFYACRS